MARVLIVDEARGLREVAEDMVARAGHDAVAVSSAYEGLEVLRREEVDVVLTADAMPGMSGARMLRDATPALAGRVPCVVWASDPFGHVPEDWSAATLATHWVRRGGDARPLLRALDAALRQRAEWLARSASAAAEGAAEEPPAREVPAALGREREAVLRGLLREAGVTPFLRVRWCASPREGLAAAGALFAALGPWSPPQELLRALLAPSYAPPLWGGREPRHDDDVQRAVRDRLRAEARELSSAERDARLLALLLGVQRPARLPDTDPAGPDWLWLLADGTAVAVAPPVAVRRDALGRLHGEREAAIRYADGWGVHLLAGHPVPERYVLRPETLTVDEVRAAQDDDLRRALRARYGSRRYLVDARARIVDVDTVPVLAAEPAGDYLSRALVEDERGDRFLIASDGSSPRVYDMRVPHACATCGEAAEALAGRRGFRAVAEA